MPSLYEYKRMGYTNGYKIDKDIPLDKPTKSNIDNVKVDYLHTAYKKLTKKLLKG